VGFTCGDLVGTVGERDDVRTRTWHRRGVSPGTSQAPQNREDPEEEGEEHTVDAHFRSWSDHSGRDADPRLPTRTPKSITDKRFYCFVGEKCRMVKDAKVVMRSGPISATPRQNCRIFGNHLVYDHRAFSPTNIIPNFIILTHLWRKWIYQAINRLLYINLNYQHGTVIQCVDVVNYRNGDDGSMNRTISLI
jgi:hypothetical protein